MSFPGISPTQPHLPQKQEKCISVIPRHVTYSVAVSDDWLDQVQHSFAAGSLHKEAVAELDTAGD